ncbi:MAG: alpha/beta fold hydrolase [Janthinobacterium lividum]
MNAALFVEHRIVRESGHLYAREYPGAFPTFVLMHGFPDNLHIYVDLIPHLVAAGRRVVAFDFLGFGESDKPTGATYSFAQQVGDLKTVVEALSLGRVVPVGHDSSGPAALNFALDYPQYVHSLCLLNSFYGRTPTLRFPEFIELFATKNIKPLTQALLRSPEQFSWILNFQRAQFQEHLTEAQKAYYKDFLGPLIDANFRQQPSSGPAFGQMTFQLFDEVEQNTLRLFELESLEISVNIIWGETDQYLHPGVARHLGAHLKHAHLHLLPAGHWLMLDAPALVAQAMLTAERPTHSATSS